MFTATLIFKLIIVGITASLLFAMADDWFDNGGFR